MKSPWAGSGYGAAALLLAARPTATTSQLKDALLEGLRANSRLQAAELLFEEHGAENVSMDSVAEAVEEMSMKQVEAVRSTGSPFLSVIVIDRKSVV